MRGKLFGAVLPLLLLTACAPGVDQEAFAPVYRAAQDIQGATSVGVSLIRYRELLGTYASQVAQAKDHVHTDRERLMVEQYAFALQCYRDAATVWAAKIEHGMPSGWIYPDKVPESDALITKYHLNLQPSPYRPELQMFHTEDAMQEIWRRAGQALALANTAYIGK